MSMTDDSQKNLEWRERMEKAGFDYTSGPYPIGSEGEYYCHIERRAFDAGIEACRKDPPPEFVRREDVKKLVEALKFYAAGFRHDVYVGPTQELLDDQGVKAITAIKAWEARER